MRANMVLRIFKAVRDAIRIDRAFSAAAQNRNDEALRALGGLGEDAKKLYDVKLLKGALYSLLNMHDQAVDELASAAQQIKASRRFSKAEANYLVAYAIQYWEHSADQIGLSKVSKQIADVLDVEGPIELSRIPAHLRRKFR
jgi:hypothetical protein